MKTQITVEIPDGYEITSLYRGNQYGEHDDRSAAIPYTIHIRPAKPFLINGVPSDWPDWLKCDWITKDEDGGLYLHKSEPQRESDGWFCTNGVHYLDKSLIAIDIPGPWEQSLRENPQRKK